MLPPVNNATAFTGFYDVTPASPVLRVHVSVLRVAKSLYLGWASRGDVSPEKRGH